MVIGGGGGFTGCLSCDNKTKQAQITFLFCCPKKVLFINYDFKLKP